MTTKILAALGTFLVDCGIAVVMGVMLLVAMNGFSESDATPGLVAYLVISVGGAIVTSAAAWLLSDRLIKRGTGPVASFFISMPAATIVGGVLVVVAMFVAVAIAEYVRTHR